MTAHTNITATKQAHAARLLERFGTIFGSSSTASLRNSNLVSALVTVVSTELVPGDRDARGAAAPLRDRCRCASAIEVRITGGWRRHALAACLQKPYLSASRRVQGSPTLPNDILDKYQLSVEANDIKLRCLRHPAVKSIVPTYRLPGRLHGPRARHEKFCRSRRHEPDDGGTMTKRAIRTTIQDQ